MYSPILEIGADAHKMCDIDREIPTGRTKFLRFTTRNRPPGPAFAGPRDSQVLLLGRGNYLPVSKRKV